MNPISLYTFLNHPVEYFQQLQKKHGDPFPLTFPQVPTIWLTGKTSTVKEIFTATSDSFIASEYNPVRPLLGSSGLIMQSGREHLDMRRKMNPYFSKFQTESFSEKIKTIFLNYLKSIPSSGLMDIQNFSSQVSLDIILFYLFPTITEDEIKNLKPFVTDFLMSYSPNRYIASRWFSFLMKGFEKAKHALDRELLILFNREHRNHSDGPLAQFFSSKTSSVLDQIRTLIVAGHETSASTLVWLLYYLHKDEKILNRLYDEISFYPDEDYLQNCLLNNYLDAVVKESLRIHSPVPFVTRKIAKNNFILNNREFLRGDEVGVCILLLHLQKDVWKNPNHFNPDRFIGHYYTPFEFAAFGGGARRCIGAELAVTEIKILISLFFKHFKSHLSNFSQLPEIKVKQITIGTKDSIMLNYVKR